MPIPLLTLALLFGMFVIGRALEDSSYLERLSLRFFGRARSTALTFFGFGGVGLGLTLINALVYGLYLLAV